MTDLADCTLCLADALDGAALETAAQALVARHASLRACFVHDLSRPVQVIVSDVTPPWRRIDLSKVIEARFGVHLAERSVGALLWRLGFRHMSVRPHNPAQDPAAIEAHKKTSQPWSRQSSRTTPAANRSSTGGKTRHVSASKAP